LYYKIMSDSSHVQIKGIRDGLLVSLGDASWAVIHQALIERIEQQPAFFQGARLALDVGNQALKSADLTALRDQLSERGIMLWAVLSNSPITENTAQLLGLATRIHKARPQPELQTARGIDDEAALWIHKTIRSGTRIEFAGHIVILGDVNPGAEGVVHAGAQGNRQAVVCALDLSPTQLRVADEIAVAPERRSKPQPEIVRIKDGQLQAEPWTSG
jgi:septum site-determining protein MinC